MPSAWVTFYLNLNLPRLVSEYEIDWHRQLKMADSTRFGSGGSLMGIRCNL